GPAVPVAMPEPAEAAASAAGFAAVGALAYAAFRWRYLGPWFLLPMYSRLSRSELLENEIRQRLMEQIEDQPGMALQELAEVSGAGWGTTVYHLQRLEQAGFINSRKQGHHRRFYKVGELDRADVEAVGMLRNDTPQKIARYLLKDPGCNQKAICEALDISPSLAHKYLKRMEEQALVTSEREWRSKHYTPDDRLATLVEQAA
ncbi:MAG: winged helix-turn-helix transcriptional regulator, partial [Candidatus Thermoplasmatota archaeon]|nr:winged helix-turn-helix transcriptional regulator [Candidatus Thermoplasmatota archaeon]